jgi:hypothetical protein
MSAKTAIKPAAKICPASFLMGSIISISSLIPMKKTMINPEIMYISSNLKYAPAKITVDSISPINTAIPPRVGVVMECDVRPLGLSQRFFDLEICTIDGMINQVIPNAIKNPRMISIQRGKDIDEMLKGKVVNALNDKVTKIYSKYFSCSESIQIIFFRMCQ